MICINCKGQQISYIPKKHKKPANVVNSTAVPNRGDFETLNTEKTK